MDDVRVTITDLPTNAVVQCGPEAVEVRAPARSALASFYAEVATAEARRPVMYSCIITAIT